MSSKKVGSSPGKSSSPPSKTPEPAKKAPAPAVGKGNFDAKAYAKNGVTE